MFPVCYDASDHANCFGSFYIFLIFIVIYKVRTATVFLLL